MQLFKSVALATAVFVMTLCNARAGVTSLVHTIEISGAGDATHKWVVAFRRRFLYQIQSQYHQPLRIHI